MGRVVVVELESSTMQGLKMVAAKDFLTHIIIGKLNGTHQRKLIFYVN
jgi:hypothetical protein